VINSEAYTKQAHACNNLLRDIKDPIQVIKVMSAGNTSHVLCVVEEREKQLQTNNSSCLLAYGYRTQAQYINV
jgi:hypothetical protein